MFCWSNKAIKKLHSNKIYILSNVLCICVLKHLFCSNWHYSCLIFTVSVKVTYYFSWLLIGATDYTGLRTPILHQQLFWVLMQQLFITVAYYIGDSENIEQMQNELCILFLDREHSEIRGYGLYKKGYHFQTNIINKYTCFTNKSSYFYNCV